jgi:hypothetical protein
VCSFVLSLFTNDSLNVNRELEMKDNYNRQCLFNEEKDRMLNLDRKLLMDRENKCVFMSTSLSQ